MLKPINQNNSIFGNSDLPIAVYFAIHFAIQIVTA
jgi:hypothetical protein